LTKEIIITLNCISLLENFTGYRDEKDEEDKNGSICLSFFIPFILVKYVLNACNKRNYINRHGKKVKHASAQNEQMPNRVMMFDAFPTVENCA
jgi:hypothetical protein